MLAQEKQELPEVARIGIDRVNSEAALCGEIGKPSLNSGGHIWRRSNLSKILQLLRHHAPPT